MKLRFGIYPSWQRDSDPIGIADPDRFTTLRAKFPIEGMGCVHVITEAPTEDPGYAYSRVTLDRYIGGMPAGTIAIAGSVCETPYALSMHVHWCDRDRLIRCVLGDDETLCIWDIDWETGAGGDDVYDWARPPRDGDDPGSIERVRAIIARAESRFRAALAVGNTANDARAERAPLGAVVQDR